MDELAPGRPVAVSDQVVRIVAPNPGIMTGPGTNTYLVGRAEVMVIDPGPDDPRHLDAVAACAGDRARWIAVTHTHADHAPGAAALRARLPGPVALVGFAPGEGFEPDVVVGDGDWVGPPGPRLRAIHTPGHASDHLCYLLEGERLLLSGDHVMDASTVVIAPPDGDMAAYLTALERLRRMALRAIAPGHGRVITDPAARLDHYLRHRLRREEAVAGCCPGRSSGSPS